MLTLKSLRAQSVGEVSAYWSCVKFSGYVEMKVSRAYSSQKAGDAPVIRAKIGCKKTLVWQRLPKNAMKCPCFCEIYL